MELLSILKLMEGCNKEATLNITTNCDHEVSLIWKFMGITHTISHLKVSEISMKCIRFQRCLHVSRAVMRCRMHLRIIYQKNPKLHARVMKGALK